MAMPKAVPHFRTNHLDNNVNIDMALLKPPARPAITEKIYKNQRLLAKLRRSKVTPPTTEPHNKNFFGCYGATSTDKKFQ